jgi:hypothetical protein
MDVDALLRSTADAVRGNIAVFACALALVLPASVVLNLGVALFTRTWMAQLEQRALDFHAALSPWTAYLVGPQLLLFVLYPIVQAAITHATAEHLAGRSTTVGAAFRAAPGSLFALWANAFLASVFVALGTALCILPGLLVALCLALVTPAIVVDRLGPVQALRGSYELTKGYRLQIALLLLSIGGIGVAMSCCITGPLNFVLLPRMGNPFVMPDPRLPGPLALNTLRTVIFTALQLVATVAIAVAHARIRGIEREAGVANASEVFG